MSSSGLLANSNYFDPNKPADLRIFFEDFVKLKVCEKHFLGSNRFSRFVYPICVHLTRKVQRSSFTEIVQSRSPDSESQMI